jgi:peptide-methionine (S)-S-oxide reductase
MREIRRRSVMVFFVLLATGLIVACATSAADNPVSLPDPMTDEPVAMSGGQPTAVLAGGCFWGVEAVFKHLKGVKTATTGYSGGSAATANYDRVSAGRTGHAESVKVTYDRSQITYGQLLKVFFSVAHDPTERNRQGPDEGPQYRSVVFATTADQKRVAEAYIAQLNEARVFRRPIATEVVGLTAFYEAEGYHQDYVAHNPGSAYVRYFDLPKLDQLRKQFPDWYKR